jgi:hypothetical protein
MNPDFHDILSSFIASSVDFMLVGAYALAAHGLPRATGDIDLWVRPNRENAQRIMQALARFGAPLSEISATDFETADIVFQIGVAPRRIDILTHIDGVDFDNAWPSRLQVEIEGMMVPVIGRQHLLQNKKASGRPKDVADVAWLEEHP